MSLSLKKMILTALSCGLIQTHPAKASSSNVSLNTTVVPTVELQQHSDGIRLKLPVKPVKKNLWSVSIPYFLIAKINLDSTHKVSSLVYRSSQYTAKITKIEDNKAWVSILNVPQEEQEHIFVWEQSITSPFIYKVPLTAVGNKDQINSYLYSVNKQNKIERHSVEILEINKGGIVVYCELPINTDIVAEGLHRILPGQTVQMKKNIQTELL